MAFQRLPIVFSVLRDFLVKVLVKGSGFDKTIKDLQKSVLTIRTLGDSKKVDAEIKSLRVDLELFLSDFPSQRAALLRKQDEDSASRNAGSHLKVSDVWNAS